MHVETVLHQTDGREGVGGALRDVADEDFPFQLGVVQDVAVGVDFQILYTGAPRVPDGLKGIGEGGDKMRVVIENPTSLRVFFVVLQLAAVQGQEGPRLGGADEEARGGDGDRVETELARPDLLTRLGYGGPRTLLDGCQLEAASQSHNV